MKVSNGRYKIRRSWQLTLFFLLTLVAYVFGQLQHPASVPALTEALMDDKEQGMVRHEAAEALGSIATPEVLEILSKYKEDNERVVRESCVVALDMYEYETR
jgi:deoxyhypusine monooxygenase